MSLSDPIADMLTRVRNAHMGGLEVVEMPHSKLKAEVTRVLKREGYITDYVVEGGTQKVLRLYLKYTDEHEPAIRGIQRESKPGLRRYVNTAGIKPVLGGLGVAILSTSAGVMSDKEARKKHVGGEVLCSVW
jgi:small subunit ribosomal protein S8